jgi:hypothetical protein
MHTSTFKLSDYKGDITVVHNGDWSGDAEILYQEKGVKGILPDGEKQSVKVPGRLLVELSRKVAVEAVKNHLISVLEQATDKEIPT